MTEQNENNVTMGAMTPGQMLRIAREAKGWTINDVSEYTRLTVQCIRDIEADNYQHVAAPVYLHGYFRAYARMVGVPEEQVFEAYKQVPHEFSEQERLAPMLAADKSQIYKDVNVRKNRSLARWVSLVIVACLFLLVMLWWHDQHKHNSVMQQQVSAVHKVVKSSEAAAPAAAIAKKVAVTKPKQNKPAKLVSATDNKAASLTPNYTVTPVKASNGE